MTSRMHFTRGGQVAKGTFALQVANIGPPVGWVWVPSSGTDEYWVFDDMVYPGIQPGPPNPAQSISFHLIVDGNGDPLQHEVNGAPDFATFEAWVKIEHPDPDILTFERHSIDVLS